MDVLFVCSPADTAKATRSGFGLHVWDLDPALEDRYYKWVAIQSTLYVFSLLGYKLAILFLYLRLFSIDNKFRYAAWAVIFFVSTYLICNFITQVAGCSPIAKFWLPSIPGYCYNAIKADVAFGSMNWISDLIILALPMPIIWSMHLSRKDKIGVTLVFMSGAIACIAAIIRATFMYIDLSSYDRTWWAAETFTLSVLELNTGLICGSAACLKPFFRWLTGTETHYAKSIWYYGRRHSGASNTLKASRTKEKGSWFWKGRPSEAQEENKLGSNSRLDNTFVLEFVTVPVAEEFLRDSPC
ncbi:hypothetical protein MMC19_006307 [Ptychographa xylographoides]|nr:hypothetical protein [Ptychographa xylographoides]